jgi:hypothetical protein
LLLDPELARSAVARQSLRMTVSPLKFAKSETRDLAEHERAGGGPSRMSEPTEWRRSNDPTFAIFVAIVAVLVLAFVVLR